jgi:hypothetical protein
MVTTSKISTRPFPSISAPQYATSSVIGRDPKI